MTLEELGEKEIQLHQKLNSINGTFDVKDNQLESLGVYQQFQNIFQHYANLNKEHIEALKRGLFFIWYAMVEPPVFTGITKLEEVDELKIIKTLDRRLRQNVSDYELNWMLSYYKNWNYMFERFKSFEFFYSTINEVSITDMPDKIDKEGMCKRGSMGIYFNSLSKYNK